MRFNNFTFKNKYINISNQNICFDKIGVYTVRGLNGTGKSSVIKQIVFGINNMEANTIEQEEAYHKNRKDLFAYVPQNIYCPDTSVIDYVTKNDKSISKEIVVKYMNKFGLSTVNLSQNARKLSGGEITKLCIISAIVKDTPYIIMDEPSNNLDDTSVNMLCNIIEELGTQRTLIVVTHDVRMKFKNSNALFFENGKIVEKNLFGNINLNKPKTGKKISKAKIGIKLQLTISSLLMCVLMLAMISGLIIFNYNEFSTNYAELTNENAPPQSNTIMCYQASCVYDELNQIYTDSVGIHIDESDYYNMINYHDVPELADISGIDAVYISDFMHIENLIEALRKDYSNNETIPFSSIPEVIYKDYIGTTGLQDIYALELGTFPRDNKNEIVLSENILKTISDKDANDLLNSEILFNEVKYTLVGVGIHDMAWISYSTDNNSSFYRYNGTTYDRFCEPIINEKKEQEYELITEIENVLIISKDGYEKSVLDTLMQKYPAHNYSSYIYTIKWVEEYNKPILQRISFVNFIVSLLCSIVLILLLKSTLETDIIKIIDYENYYICSKSIKNIYLTFKFLSLFIVGAIALLLNHILCSGYNDSWKIICIPILLITISSTVFLILKTKKEVKK